MEMSVGDVALCFESLGGGSLDPANWGFGCEFGFFQREAGVEPLGLLRWASIRSEDLLYALNDHFRGIEDLSSFVLNEAYGGDWGFVHEGYRIRVDHSGLSRQSVTREEAAVHIHNSALLLRRKLLEDLRDGNKVFVYRTFDHAVPPERLYAIADAIGHYGKARFLYVQLADATHAPFSIEARRNNLMIGYINAFAPQPDGLIYNTDGWERLCRKVLARIEITEQATFGNRASATHG